MKIMSNDDKKRIVFDGADKIKLPDRNKDVIPKPPKSSESNK